MNYNKKPLLPDSFTRATLNPTLTHQSDDAAALRHPLFDRSGTDAASSLQLIISMELHTLDDEQLIALIAQGDASALAALYDRYGRLVFSLALSAVSERTMAEEITQDVFTRIWRHAERYDPRQAQVNTWISHIARNRSIDALRKMRVRKRVQSVKWDDQIMNQLPADRDPESLTLHRERAIQVRQALRHLPDAQRQVIILAYLEGLSQREIAQRLQLPLGTVKTRIRLGMQKLRTLLTSETDEPSQSLKTQNKNVSH